MPKRLIDTLEQLAQLPPPPSDAGKVEGLVLRPAKGKRRVVNALQLTPEGGIDGDRWGQKNHRTRHRQVSAIRADILACLAADQDMALSGDNLHLSIDLSEENLPIGAVLEVGEVRFTVSPEHHAPCGLFSSRFGQEAHDATLSPIWRSLRARGVLLQVIQGGRIVLGDAVRVVRR